MEFINLTTRLAPRDAPGPDLSAPLRSVSVTMILGSTLVLCGRGYSRLMILKNAGWDDLIAVVAYVALIIYDVFSTLTTKYGSGRHISEVSSSDLEKLQPLLVTCQFIYIIASGLVRISIAAFFPRLTTNGTYRRIIRLSIVALALVTVAEIASLLFQCNSLSGLWAPKPSAGCVDLYHQNFATSVSGIIGVVFDILLLIVPIWLGHSEMIFTLKDCRIIFVFAVGLVACIMGILRVIAEMSLDPTIDPTYLTAQIAKWSVVESNVGFWVAGFPALQPFISIIVTHFGRHSGRFNQPRETEQRYAAAFGSIVLRSQPQHESITHHPLVGSSRCESFDHIESTGKAESGILQAVKTPVTDNKSNTTNLPPVARPQIWAVV